MTTTIQCLLVGYNNPVHTWWLRQSSAYLLTTTKTVLTWWLQQSTAYLMTTKVQCLLEDYNNPVLTCRLNNNPVLTWWLQQSSAYLMTSTILCLLDDYNNPVLTCWLQQSSICDISAKILSSSQKSILGCILRPKIGTNISFDSNHGLLKYFSRQRYIFFLPYSISINIVIYDIK